MRLCELFGDDGDDPDLNDVVSQIKQSLMDVLTPMVATKVPFVTMQQITDKLNQLGTGLDIDRGLITDLLNPDKIKIVKKIEGDRVYLSQPISDERKVDQRQRERDEQNFKKTASDQAKKNLTSGNGPL